MSKRDQFVLSAGQCHELELAMRRPENGVWTPALVTAMAQGNMLAGFYRVLQGSAQIVPVDFWRSMLDLGDEIIRIPALKRPTLGDLCEKYPWIRKDQGILQDTSPEHEVVLDLGTLLLESEERISGDEYTRRRSSLTGILGYQHLRWLVDNQDEHPVLKALLGQIYIDGPGIIVVDEDGNLDFPYLSQDGERWYLYWIWAVDVLHRRGRLARSRK